MIVYCDTSFLVSFLNEQDVNQRAARSLAGKHRTGEFVVCEVHLLEVPVSVRAAIHREVDPIPADVARRVINRFDRAVNRKMFQRKRLEGDEALNMARSLGEAHGWKERHTSFDLWHLAAAWALSARVFLTFDRRQRRIANLLGMA
ncbi:MAG: type II toxin-antitoxin system VapC family toxin [Verrucomicrobia bacterium]|nr:type II toxin-antitoxin system VapC family toxin [Verrucomicrobiota bacterium]